MQIVKLFLFIENQWNFKGCYVLNLKYDNMGEISKYHFYTIDYFIDSGIKRMCIQPLSILSSDHINDTSTQIDERLVSWFKNCNQIHHYGIDVLGQQHGMWCVEKYQKFQEGEDWANVTKKYDDIEVVKEHKNLLVKESDNIDKFREFRKNINNAVDRCTIACALDKDVVLAILASCKKISINEIFSN